MDKAKDGKLNVTHEQFFNDTNEIMSRNDKYDLSFEMEPQNYLNFITNMDTCKFLEGVTGNWNNHLPLLLLGLHLTGGYVVEFGSGEGSTERLRNYCAANKRPFSTYDNNREWAEKTGSMFITDWGGADVWHPCSLLFIDHAPGEHRKVAIERMMDSADIIIVHDTEQGGAGDYGFEPVFSKFRYRLNYNKTGGGAGATAVSNKIDLNQFRGLSLGAYTFDND